MKKERINTQTMPKAVVELIRVNLGTVRLGSVQRFTVVIRNRGGNFSNILISSTDPCWLQLERYRSMSKNKMLPLKLWIKVEAKEPGKVYYGFLSVKLDGVETRVEVRLRTRKQKAVKAYPESKVVPLTSEKLTTKICLIGKTSFISTVSKIIPAVKNLPKKSLIGAALVAALIFIIFTMPSEIIKQGEEPIEVKPALSLDSLDRWIEEILIFKLTPYPEKTYRYWYNDNAMLDSNIWVTGGITFVGNNLLFKTINFVYLSQNKGQGWQVSWQTGDNGALKTDKLKIVDQQKIAVLLRSHSLNQHMLYTKNSGASWNIYSEWKPKILK